jgi:hypothetical protein
MVLTEIQTHGYEVFLDAVDEQPRQTNGAIRMIRLRRRSGAPARYTPEMQFTKFIKEAKEGRNISNLSPAPRQGIKQGDFENCMAELRAVDPGIFEMKLGLMTSIYDFDL